MKFGFVWWIGVAEIVVILFLELATYLGKCPRLSERSDEDFYSQDTTFFSLLTTKQIKIWLLEE